jgi:hypothetical protein
LAGADCYYKSCPTAKMGRWSVGKSSFEFTGAGQFFEEENELGQAFLLLGFSTIYTHCVDNLPF